MNSQPYPPSFVDRWMASVERLPIPYFVTYSLFFLFESALIHIVAWVDGWLPAYTFSAFALMFPLWLWGPLAIMTYLNSVSLEALSSFRPLLHIPDQAVGRLKYEFTRMPARRVLLNGAFWSVVYFGFTYLALDSMYAAMGLEVCPRRLPSSPGGSPSSSAARSSTIRSGSSDL